MGHDLYERTMLPNSPTPRRTHLAFLFINPVWQIFWEMFLGVLFHTTFKFKITKKTGASLLRD